MKKHIKKVVKWIKEQPIKGCITGSCMIGYFDNQDVDVFVYDEKSFNKILYAMEYNKDFQILDPLEKWKYDQYMTKNNDNFYKFGLITIKFTYNTCVDVNIILKKRCFNIFSVLETFDMDIIAKGYDIGTKQYLDLSEKKGDKVVTWNKWNPVFYSSEVWQISRVLRQLERCFKYYKRGYNVDEVVKKYISLIEEIQNYTNIFSSESYTEQLKVRKDNTKIVKQICVKWLETHIITDEQIELLKLKIREI